MTTSVTHFPVKNSVEDGRYAAHGACGLEKRQKPAQLFNKDQASHPQKLSIRNAIAATIDGVITGAVFTAMGAMIYPIAASEIRRMNGWEDSCTFCTRELTSFADVLSKYQESFEDTISNHPVIVGVTAVALTTSFTYSSILRYRYIQQKSEI